MVDLIERNKKLRDLRERMQEELTQWAEANEVLNAGETLYFTLEVVKRESARVPKVKHTSKKPQVNSRFIELDEDDWKKILAVDWNEQQKLIIDAIYKNKNKPTRIRYRPHSRLKQKMEYGRWDGIDYRFRKFKLPYRLGWPKRPEPPYGWTVPGEHSSYFEDHCFQIWSIPEVGAEQNA